MREKQRSTAINEIFIYIAISISLVVFVLASFPQFGVGIAEHQILLLAVILILLLFRHFREIEITGFPKLSKEVEEVRKETRELRSALQSFAASHSTLSASVNIGEIVRSIDEATQEAAEIESEIPSIPNETAVYDPLRLDAMNIRRLIEEGQFIAAFATLKRRITTALREILWLRGEELASPSMFRLITRAQKLKILNNSVIEALMVMNKAANSILHSAPYEKTIPLEKARYISDLGTKTLYELHRVKKQFTQQDRSTES